MSASSAYQVTELLLAWGKGDRDALDKLVPLVHSELKRLARRYMRNERPGHTLQTTALVNEAFVRLIDARKIGWQSRGHFFGIASRLMRQVLVDFARAQKYQKRGGGALRVSFDEQLQPGRGPNENLLAVDEALSALAEIDARKCQVVEMRFFGGLKEKEIAAALGVSEETVRRD